MAANIKKKSLEGYLIICTMSAASEGLAMYAHSMELSNAHVLNSTLVSLSVKQCSLGRQLCLMATKFGKRPHSRTYEPFYVSEEGPSLVRIPGFTFRGTHQEKSPALLTRLRCNGKMGCFVCDSLGTKVCSKCKIAHYCSSEHQKEDWKRHKLECAVITNKSAEFSAIMKANKCRVAEGKNKLPVYSVREARGFVAFENIRRSLYSVV
jgi:hypothetical protein